MASSGRLFTISKAASVLAGLRENSLAVDGSPVDITDKGDSGYRTLADFAGSESFEITASGVVDDAVLRAAALGGTSKLLTDVTVEYANGDTLACDVYLSSFTEAGAHDGENTYDVTLQSSGAWTYTAAP